MKAVPQCLVPFVSLGALRGKPRTPLASSARPRPIARMVSAWSTMVAAYLYILLQKMGWKTRFFCLELAQPWARGEREGYGGPRDVISLSLSDTRGLQ